MQDTTTRNAELEQMLQRRRREVQNDVQNRIQSVRTDRPKGVLDDVENSDANSQSDIEFALIQLKAETLSRIDAALARLLAGEYGYRFECRDEISEKRLKALPFAVRCMACEERREQSERRNRLPRGAPSFGEVASC